ncbi:SDR family NAD(P)-dependent oxidoreductase [Paraferrimonas sedimenticola]|uniref:Short-chain dehydrogenase n=1 Tax=Paraferrimonas sedimenticola TaxID=375674 RepID=A0AA37RWT9_9GAMM|nr:SDR family oxidoreductase [Paraferrimonas sedimenticola]GLP96404.1 short-chain dehydrogenase [Paraferrimonas sedimenticola]
MTCVVITGSTRGIGRGLAKEFLELGAKVVVSGRSQPAVDEVVALLAQTYGEDKVTGKACDITDVEALKGLWSHAKERFGKVDHWINNAGMSITRANIHQQAPSELSRIIDTNLTAVLLAANVVIEGLVEQQGGTFWVMEGFGSNGATQPGMTAYGASKRAVTYVAKALQKEVKGTGVNVNYLSPGIVVTDLLIGDYDTSSQEWQKSKRIFNILGDRVETVTPYLAKGVLAASKSGTRVAWLTGGKAFARFMSAPFKKRELFADLP